MQTAFRMENLASGYEQVRVFEGLNLTIEEGKVTTIIGPNGCGKSTLLKTIGLAGAKYAKFIDKGYCTEASNIITDTHRTRAIKS